MELQERIENVVSLTPAAAVKIRELMALLHTEPSPFVTALERLPDYRDRLTDLALDLGFSSHSHFSDGQQATNIAVYTSALDIRDIARSGSASTQNPNLRNRLDTSWPHHTDRRAVICDLCKVVHGPAADVKAAYTS